MGTTALKTIFDPRNVEMNPRCRNCGYPVKVVEMAFWPDDAPSLFDPPHIKKVHVCEDPRCGTDDRWMWNHEITTGKMSELDRHRNKTDFFYENYLLSEHLSKDKKNFLDITSA